MLRGEVWRYGIGEPRRVLARTERPESRVHDRHRDTRSQQDRDHRRGNRKRLVLMMMHRLRTRSSDEQGTVLIIVLIMMVVFSLILAATLSNASANFKNT